MAGLNIIASEGTCVRVSDDGGANFKELPGVQSHVEGGGDLNQTQVKAFKGSASRLSLPDVSSITISALYTPTHPAWRLLSAAARIGTLLTWEVFTERQDIFAKDAEANNFAISAAGVLTFPNNKGPNFRSGDYGEGMTFDTVDGNTIKAYTIESITTAGVATLEHGNNGAIYYNGLGVRAEEAAAVAAANLEYKIRTPQEYLRYSAKAGKPPAALENEGNMSTSFTVYPQTLLGDWLVRAAA